MLFASPFQGPQGCIEVLGRAQRVILPIKLSIPPRRARLSLWNTVEVKARLHELADETIELEVVERNQPEAPPSQPPEPTGDAAPLFRAPTHSVLGR